MWIEASKYLAHNHSPKVRFDPKNRSFFNFGDNHMHYFEYQAERCCHSFPDSIDFTRSDSFPEHVDFTMTPEEQRLQTTGGATTALAAA